MEFVSSEVTVSIDCGGDEADQRPSCFLLSGLPAQQSEGALEEQIVMTAKK